jgi:hypothetical protein
MTEQEARSVLNKFRNANYNEPLDSENHLLAMAIDIVLPQYVRMKEAGDIPVKVKLEDRGYKKVYHCGVCDMVLCEENSGIIIHKHNRCPHCLHVAQY